MTPERWAQIEELFHRAAECDAKQRTALLDQACGTDAELRREIEELLSSELSARDCVQDAVWSELYGFGFSLVGKVVSHYRILDGLGGGGMGLVYRAEDIRLGRQVALKFLPEGSAKDATALARFEREARAASALEHPNICPIYEFGEQDGQPFLVMPLLEGQTLRELLENKAETSKYDASVGQTRRLVLDLDQVVELAIQIANGLEAAHQKGVIHRDIKPANIFVTSQNQAKILDFGLAKLARGAAEVAGQPGESVDGTANRGTRETAPLVTSGSLLSQTGVAMGTAGYMSPEQVRGEKLDARTDLFSFGLVLYEMATGTQGFTGETTPKLYAAILTGTPKPIRELNPKVSPKLERIISKALEKNRDIRYQSATAMMTDLKRLEGSHRSVAVTSRISVIGIAAILLLVIGGFFLRKWMPRSPGLLANMEITRLTDSGRAENVGVSPDGRYVVYSRHESGGVGLWVRQVATQSDVQLLPATAVGFKGLSFSPDGNYVYFVRPDSNDPGFKYLFVVPALGGPLRQLVKDIDSPVSFSPDGREFVYTRGIPTRYATEIRIAAADGSNNHLLATMTDVFGETGATWSPDGRTIAVALMRTKLHTFMLYTIRVADGTVSEFFPSSSAIGRALWLPEGNAMLTVLSPPEGRGQLWAVSYPEKGARRLTNDLSDYDLRTDLTRDGNTLAAIDSRLISNLWVAPREDTSRAQQITSLSLPLYSVDEAPDGKLLANSGGKLWAFTANGRQRELFTDLDGVGVVNVCGRFVVLNLEPSEPRQLMRFEADGSNATKLASGDLEEPTCSPDGKYVFYLELGPPQKIKRIPVEGGTPMEITTVLGENMAGRMSFSSDSKRLAYPFEQYTPTPKIKLAIIPAEGGPPLRQMDLPGRTYEDGSPRWSSDDKSLDYIRTQDGSSNIWEQSLDGGPPRQLTNFSSGRIFDFSWSRDGKRLLLVRGEVSSDVVLLSHLH